MAKLVPATIVVGADASPDSLAALDWALAQAVAVGARLVVVHGVGLLEGAGIRAAVDLDALVGEARTRLGLIEPADVATVAEPGEPAEALLRVVTREGADLVVVGRRGMGGARRLLGSTSEAVLERCGVPVVVLPSPS